MTDDHDEDRRAFVRRLFESRDEAPRDIVRGPRPTREYLLAMNDKIGTITTGTIPGDLIEGPDGEPIGVGPSRECRSYFGGLIVTRAEVERAGLTERDIPKIRVMDLPPRTTNETGA